MMETNPSLPYALCALSAVGVMALLVLLVWHNLRFRATSATRFIKYSITVLLVAYIITGFSVTLLVLHKDVNSPSLCRAGGFFLLFSTQEVLWMTAVTAAVLLLWKRGRSPWKREEEAEPSHRWSLPIYWLALVVKCIILGIVSFLPLTDIQYFDSTSEFYYMCTPLRLPGEKGWGYSTLILLLDWAALITTLVLLLLTLLTSYRHSHQHQHLLYSSSKTSSSTTSTSHLTFRLLTTLSLSSILWFLLLLLLSLSYFSAGSILSQDAVVWVLGYLLIVVLLLQPVSAAALAALLRPGAGAVRGWLRSRLAVMSQLERKCPRALDSVRKIDNMQQGVTTYLVKWRDKSGGLLPGTMHVYHPSSRQRWLAHSQAATRLGNHPNLAAYHWESSTNRFVDVIEAFTGETHSQHSSLLCHQHFPHGTLSEFLHTKVHRLTDIGLHKVTLDIASGLDYLHQHHLVHNSLTTHTVYMASVSEKIGLRVVLGDFDQSYEVCSYASSPYSADLESRAGSLFSITSSVENITSSAGSGEAETCRHFAADIRAFGLVVLEMLMAMTQYQQHRQQQIHMQSESQSLTSATATTTTSPRAQLEETRSLDALQLSSAFKVMKKATGLEVTPDRHTHGKKCTCSHKVTDIRVTKPKREKLYLNVSAGGGKDKSSLELEKDNQNQNSSSSESLSNLDPEKVRKIQQRKLPPIPPRGSSLKEKSQQQHHQEDMNTSEESGKSSSDEHSPHSTLSSSKSSDEEHYNASSIGSLGSFDTIYEDEERKSFHSGLSNSSTGRTARRYAHKSAAAKRKQIANNSGKSDTWQRSKRMSGASFDDSVVSSDSGVGSSHYDVESASGGSSLEGFTNVPGSRGPMYSSEKQQSYSLIMSYLGRDTDSAISSDVTSHHSAPANMIKLTAKVKPALKQQQQQQQAVQEDIVDFEEDPEFAQGLPDLRIHKKPCLGDHPHIHDGPCHHHNPPPPPPPHTSGKPPLPSKPPIPSRSRRLKKPMPLPQEAATAAEAAIDPVYEKIPSPKQQAAPTTSTSLTSTVEAQEVKLLVDTGTNTGDSLKKKQRLQQQQQQLPTESEDEANHGKSLDVASIVSMVQGADTRSVASAPVVSSHQPLPSHHHHHHSKRKHLHHQHQQHHGDSVSLVSAEPSLLSVASSQTSDCCSKCGSNLQPAESHLSLASTHSYGGRRSTAQPKLGVAAFSASRRLSQSSLQSLRRTPSTPTASRSLTSSALSMIHDTNLILRTIDASSARHAAAAASRGGGGRTAAAGGGVGGVGGERERMEQAIQQVSRQGQLGFTAEKLVPLLSECCTDGPAPSADHILKRLQQVLPTASV